MKKIKLITLPLLALVLSGCSIATRELYKSGEYNSADFEKNYYTSWNNVNNIKPIEVKHFDVTPGISDPDVNEPLVGLKYPDQYTSNNELLEWNTDTPVSDNGRGYGPTKNLTSIDKSFAYGYLSKLYDGRVRCDGYYTRSRVQLNKTGYATFFPKALSTYKYFGMAVRGGTGAKYDHSYNLDCKVNFHVSFYVRDMEKNTYTQFVFDLNNIKVKTNAGGRTDFINFYYEDVLGENWNTMLNNATAMSITYELASSPYDDLVDDMTSEDCHFCIMLYEVMLPESTWF